MVEISNLLIAMAGGGGGLFLIGLIIWVVFKAIKSFFKPKERNVNDGSVDFKKKDMKLIKKMVKKGWQGKQIHQYLLEKQWSAIKIMRAKQYYMELKGGMK